MILSFVLCYYPRHLRSDQNISGHKNAEWLCSSHKVRATIIPCQIQEIKKNLTLSANKPHCFLSYFYKKPTTKSSVALPGRFNFYQKLLSSCFFQVLLLRHPGAFRVPFFFVILGLDPRIQVIFPFLFL